MFRHLLILAALVGTWAHAKTYPTEGAAPKRLVVLDMRGETDFETRCLAASAQGLVNSADRTGTKVYLIWETADANWAQWLVRTKRVQSAKPLGSLQELIRLTGTKRAVCFDAKPFHLCDIATVAAGCERMLLVGDEPLLARFGLTAAIDLRNKFSSNAQAYRWVWDRYHSRIKRNIASITVPFHSPTHNPANTRDYLVANRVFTFWISGDKEKQMKGANRADEERAVGDILKSMTPDTPVLGYPWSGDGYGPGEWDGVTYLSQHARYLIPTDTYSNLSVWTCFPPSQRKLPAPKPPVRDDGHSTYASFVMSDGDNLCTFQSFFPDYWARLADRSFPVGWTMGPTLRELAPPLYDYALDAIPAGHSVGSGVSGVGYVAMEEYGKAYGAARLKHVRAFMAATGRACQSVGERWLWIMRYGGYRSPWLAEYAKIPGIHAAIGGYGRAVPRLDQTFERIGALSVVHSYFDCSNSVEFGKRLKEFLATPGRPRFFSVFILNWNYSPDQLAAAAAELREQGVTIVRPEDLAAMAR